MTFLKVLLFIAGGIVLLIGLVVAVYWFAHGFIGSGSKEKLFETAHEGHRLRLERSTTVVGFGVKSTRPELSFDGREVLGGYRLPVLLPAMYPDLVVKTYSVEPNSWSVYVSPAQFSRSEFDQIVACYEANRAGLDGALKQHFAENYQTEWAQRVGQLIYGEEPKPLVFRPAQPRYQLRKTADNQFAVQEEWLHVKPNGLWELRTKTTIGGLLGEVEDFITGDTLQMEGDRLRFVEPPAEKWYEGDFFLRFPDRAEQHNRDYLRSFANADGKRLYDLFLWP
jgi:hypothetical protein